MGMFDWIRGFGERKRARIAEEESTLSAKDRAAIEAGRDARRGFPEPRYDPHYLHLDEEFKKH